MAGNSGIFEMKWKRSGQCLLIAESPIANAKQWNTRYISTVEHLFHSRVLVEWACSLGCGYLVFWATHNAKWLIFICHNMMWSTIVQNIKIFRVVVRLNAQCAFFGSASLNICVTVNIDFQFRLIQTSTDWFWKHSIGWFKVNLTKSTNRIIGTIWTARSVFPVTYAFPQIAIGLSHLSSRFWH